MKDVDGVTVQLTIEIVSQGVDINAFHLTPPLLCALCFCARLFSSRPETQKAVCG